MRLVLGITLISLLLGEGWALTCHCQGEGASCNNSVNSCTGAPLCYLRIVYEQHRGLHEVEYGCMSDIGGLINPSLVCNRTTSDGIDELHFLCCDDYDFCNRDISIPSREFGPSPSSSPFTPTPTPTHSPTGNQDIKISLWLLLTVTIIPSVFIINLFLCVLLGIQLRRYHRIRKQEQRESEVKSTGSDKVQFVNFTTST